MSTCFRPHCAIRSHHHEDVQLPEHEIQDPEVEETYRYEIDKNEIQVPDFPTTPCTFAEFLQYSQHFCDIAKNSFFDDKSLITDYIFLFNDHRLSNLVKKHLLTKILQPLMLMMTDMVIIDNRKLGLVYIFSILRTPIGKYVLKDHELFYKTVHKKYIEFLNESQDDLYFIEQMSKI